MGVKAYELVPVIEQLHLLGDSKIKIECIECFGKELYVGTNFSQIILYNLEEEHFPNGRVFYSSKEILNICLDLKKPIKYIKTASALKRILVLCDSNLYLMSMTTLEFIDSNPKLKTISTLCVNENPIVNDPYSLQICVVKKKRLQILNLTHDKFDVIKDFNIGDVASEVALDGFHICAALSSHYNVFNFKNSSKQELFGYGNENVFPVIKRIGKEEFLVNAPGNLGVFATVTGMTTRPPIQWSTGESVLGIAYAHPYILGITEEMLMIYSILDQKQKQAIPYNARGIGNFDGRLLIHSSCSVHGLIPVPWHFQVEMLLSEDKIDEAMELAQNASSSSTPKEIFMEHRRRLEQRAAFLYLAQGDMAKALSRLVHSHVDPREVISLFPGLLPATSNFIRAVPPLHDFADIEQLFPKDPVIQNSCRHLLHEFLLAVRRDPKHFFPLEVETALIKLSCELTPSNELDHVLCGLFSKNSELLCDVDDCRMWLNARAYWHALAILENRAGNEAVALEIWSSLVTKEKVDNAFPGLDYFTEILRNVEHVSLMWRYAELIFSRDITLGVTVLTRRSNRVPSINPHDATEYLQRYPKAQIAYLEYLVFEDNIQEEYFHTTLALQYMECVIHKNKQSYDIGTIEQVHSKLRHLLRFSNLYRVQTLLTKAREGGLLNEMALLHGKLKEHDKALAILVERLKDYSAAEEYCIVHSTLNENLFHHLLRIYLDPKSGNSEELTERALQLLNAKGDELDASLVLAMVPENWSVSMLSSFLHASLRTSMHKYRLRKVEASLARGENLQKRFALYDLQRHSILMHPNNYCCVCKKPFGNGAFARYPNDVLTHVDCVKNKHVCPVTGKNFKTLSAS